MASINNTPVFHPLLLRVFILFSFVGAVKPGEMING